MKNRKLKNSELGRIDAQSFKGSEKTPLIIILDNIRSLNNIGSVFRTADAFLILRRGFDDFGDSPSGCCVSFPYRKVCARQNRKILPPGSDRAATTTPHVLDPNVGPIPKREPSPILPADSTVQVANDRNESTAEVDRCFLLCQKCRLNKSTNLRDAKHDTGFLKFRLAMLRGTRIWRVTSLWRPRDAEPQVRPQDSVHG